MFRLKVPRSGPSVGIEETVHLAVAMDPRGEFATLSQAIAEAQRRGMDFERTVIENLKTSECYSVQEWINLTDKTQIEANCFD